MVCIACTGSLRGVFKVSGLNQSAIYSTVALFPDFIQFSIHVYAHRGYVFLYHELSVYSIDFCYHNFRIFCEGMPPARKCQGLFF